MDAIKQIIEKETSLLIAIGSAEDFGTEENPFTASERYEMIDSAMKEYIKKCSFTIIPIRDIHDDAKWVAHLERLLPKFGNVYTGSPIVKKLFLKDKKHKVIGLKKRLNIDGTTVREMLRNNTKGSWKKLVPQTTIKLL